MTKVVQDFLWAQKVQEPIALFSDWLFVGHVDEFMTFVPAPDRKVLRNHEMVKRQEAFIFYWLILTHCYVHCRIVEAVCLSFNPHSCFSSQHFRLLLASPDAAYKLFRGLQKDGHGQAKMFDGRVRVK